VTVNKLIPPLHKLPVVWPTNLHLYFTLEWIHGVFHLRRYDHVTDALAILHWLCLPQRVDFKVAVMVFRVLHGLAPPYLNQLVRVSELPGHRRLRSSSSLQLLVPPFLLTTVGRCSFPVASSLLWNSLPSDIQPSSSLPVFRQRLKTFKSFQSFLDIVL